MVSAGGYKDDDDQGTSFIYTGSGGQKKGVQVRETLLHFLMEQPRCLYPNDDSNPLDIHYLHRRLDKVLRCARLDCTVLCKV